MPFSPMDVAKFFIARSHESNQQITHMKLQKLCFYAQALHLARKQRQLLAENFEAWKHGPVCPELYDEFKSSGAAPIDSDIVRGFDALETFDDDALETLEETWEMFGQKTAGQLRNLTHAEEAWKHSYGNVGPGAVIMVKDIYSIYSTLFGEKDHYDALLEEYRREPADNGSLTEPTADMVLQMKENHLLFSGLQESALKGYLGRVK